MVGIFVTFFLAVLGLGLLLALCLLRDESESETVHKNDVPIAGLSAIFLPFEIILGKDDYRKLREKRELKPVRQKFWRDRRQIILTWLAELEKDCRTLWHFRCFLVRHDLRVTLREEIGIAMTAFFTLLCLHVVRTMVFLFGPFVLPWALHNTGLLTKRLFNLSVAPLARVSAPRKADIEHRWNEQLLAMSG
jgi:hypothetical protein